MHFLPVRGNQQNCAKWVQHGHQMDGYVAEKNNPHGALVGHQNWGEYLDAQGHHFQGGQNGLVKRVFIN